MKNDDQMLLLIAKLKARNNKSYKFFEDLLDDLNNESKAAVALPKLLSCFAITQYAGFTHEEENLLSNIIQANDPSSTGSHKKK